VIESGESHARRGSHAWNAVGWVRGGELFRFTLGRLFQAKRSCAAGWSWQGSGIRPVDLCPALPSQHLARGRVTLILQRP
jgi:hypothetical protein